MDELRVRVYNVHFGDAILVRIPDKDDSGNTVNRHVLFDVGNALATTGGSDVVFKPVVEDILRELNGQPLDLYIMTHEHMDHIQGLPYAERYYYPDRGKTLKERLNTRYAWLTASAAEDYGKGHMLAAELRLKFERDFAEIDAYIHSASFLEQVEPQQLTYLEALLAINNPRSSKDNVAYLRDLAEHTYYVHRESDLEGMHPFHETQFELWAPEEDTSVYYGSCPSLALGITCGDEGGGKTDLREYIPPAGVDASAFYNLVDRRRQFAENLLAIDKAANNTSLVCCIKWRGWRLLFTGDAELKSWKVMQERGQLSEVDSLKVSHHGSHNGTPGESFLEILFPKREVKGKERRAVVSTWREPYPSVPDEDTLKRLYDPEISGLQPRCDKLVRVDESLDEELFVDLVFEG